jgi:hypothetical protein
LDNDDDDDVSVLTSKTQDELVALLVQARKQLSGASIGSRVASGSDLPSGSSQVAMQSQNNMGEQESILANSASSGTEGNNIGGNASNGPGGNESYPVLPLNPRGGGQPASLVDSVEGGFHLGGFEISNIVRLIGETSHVKC